MPKPNRRSFLKSSAALAAGAAVLRSAHAFATPAIATTATTPLTQFDYKDIQLLDGPMLVQFQQNHALFLNLNRLSAGLSGVVLHQSAPHEIDIAWTRRLQAKLLVKNKVENRGKFSAMKSHRQGTIFYRAFTTN